MKIILTYILLIITFSLDGQRILEKANKQFIRKEYVSALQLYNAALKKVRSNVKKQEIYYNMGECYNARNNYDLALKHFEESYRLGNNEPEVYLKLGGVLLKKGEYDDAKQYFEVYLESFPENKNVLNKLKTCDFAIRHREVLPDILVQNQNDLNTRYAEYGPGMIENQLYFSSTRLENDSINIYGVTGQAYGDFYQSEYDHDLGVWQIPIKIKGQINTSFNEGTCTFDKYTNKLYLWCAMVCREKRTIAQYIILIWINSVTDGQNQVR